MARALPHAPDGLKPLSDRLIQYEFGVHRLSEYPTALRLGCPWATGTEPGTLCAWAVPARVGEVPATPCLGPRWWPSTSKPLSASDECPTWPAFPPLTCAHRPASYLCAPGPFAEPEP